MISKEQKKSIDNFVQQISSINVVNNSNGNLFYSFGMNSSVNTVSIKLQRQSNQLIETLVSLDKNKATEIANSIEGLILTEVSLGSISNDKAETILNKLDELVSIFKKDLK